MTTARILILSDTHGKWPYSTHNPAPKADIFIHCGDLTQVGGLASLRHALEDIAAVDAELKLVIAGNHDLELDERWVRDNAEGPDDLEDGVASVNFVKSQSQNSIYFLDEGVHTFTLSSGSSLTGMHALPLNWDIDIAITHGSPRFSHAEYSLDKSATGDFCGCPKLAKAIVVTKPCFHCFGHIHEGRRAATMDSKANSLTSIEGGHNTLSVVMQSERSTTLLLNATVDGEGNLDWIVDMDLPTR